MTRKAQLEEFEQFPKATRGGQPLPDGTVSINKLNNLYFAAFSEHFPRAGHAEVLVLEDEQGNAIKLAVKPIPERTDNSYSIQSCGMKNRTAITVAALVRQYRIETKGYPAYWDAEGKRLIIGVV